MYCRNNTSLFIFPSISYDVIERKVVCAIWLIYNNKLAWRNGLYAIKD